MKSDGGQNANSQKIILLGVLIYKNYAAGYASFIHKGIHSKNTGTACMPMLSLKINYNLGSAIWLFSVIILSAAKFYLM